MLNNKKKEEEIKQGNGELQRNFEKEEKENECRTWD